jgi:MoaA/NifB/PqqE/SkfB family radical SAM enzyme
MPIEDAAFALDALERACAEHELEYTAYPMHEVTAHPSAPNVIRLFTPHIGGRYDPILTPGTPLASREDWDDVLGAAVECSAHALWVAFHGYGPEHDRQLNRPGAFAETCLAVRRAQEHGLGTGANVFVTKAALRHFDRLLAVLLDLGLGAMSIGPAAYTPTSRGRHYEEQRPTFEDLLQVAEAVWSLSTKPEIWADLGSYTSPRRPRGREREPGRRPRSKNRGRSS